MIFEHPLVGSVKIQGRGDHFSEAEGLKLWDELYRTFILNWSTASKFKIWRVVLTPFRFLKWFFSPFAVWVHKSVKLTCTNFLCYLWPLCIYGWGWGRERNGRRNRSESTFKIPSRHLLGATGKSLEKAVRMVGSCYRTPDLSNTKLTLCWATTARIIYICLMSLGYIKKIPGISVGSTFKSDLFFPLLSVRPPLEMLVMYVVVVNESIWRLRDHSISRRNLLSPQKHVFIGLVSRSLYTTPKTLVFFRI